MVINCKNELSLRVESAQIEADRILFVKVNGSKNVCCLLDPGVTLALFGVEVVFFALNK